MAGKGWPGARALLAAGLLAASPAMAADDIESPAYEVVETHAAGSMGEVELRRYAPHLVAEVTVAGASAREAASRGFRPLAEYIFGGNRPREAIAMTAPVTTSAAEGQSIAMTAPVTTTASGTRDHVVRFSMPSRWTMETLPVPNDAAVDLVEVPARTMAALRYVHDTPERRDMAEKALFDAVLAAGLRASAPVTYAGYDGPSVPVRDRRWEVMVEVDG